MASFFTIQDRETFVLYNEIIYKVNLKNEFCSECSELLEYALLRLDNCHYQEEKPICARCPIHCYNPTFRTRINSVLGYSGPRMLFKYPILKKYFFIHKIRSREEFGIYLEP